MRRPASRARPPRVIHCTPATACRIVARFESHGEAALLDGRSENGRPRLDDGVRAGIRRILEQRPSDFGVQRPTWTLELLARGIPHVLRVVLSVGPRGEILRRRARVLGASSSHRVLPVEARTPRGSYHVAAPARHPPAGR